MSAAIKTINKPFKKVTLLALMLALIFSSQGPCLHMR